MNALHISFLLLITSALSFATTPTTHFLPIPPTGTAISSAAGARALSTLSYIEHTWTVSPEYTLIESAVFVAAPTSAQLSLAISGYDWDVIVGEPWYQNVDQNSREVVDKQEEVLQKGFEAALGITSGVSHTIMKVQLVILLGFEVGVALMF